MFRQAGMVLALGSIFAVGSAMPAVWAHGTTERVSVSSGGAQGGGYEPAISADGRFVAFNSSAFNLVPGDTNGGDDVFIHDRKPGTTERVSVSSAGAQGNNSTITSPAISADGRFVAFTSYASNVVPGDTNRVADVFLRDRKMGTTKRVSVATGGAQGNGPSFYPSLSTDGRFVAFVSSSINLVPGDTNNEADVFLHDCKTGTTERVSVSSDGAQSNGLSLYPSLSADGRFVAFTSIASSLVPGDTNGWDDVFVRDRQTSTTWRVSVRTGGAQGNGNSNAAVISADGRLVAFASLASNLVPGDTNGWYDVFVHQRQTGTTRRESVSSGGAQGNGDSRYPSLSADGRFVAFTSLASNLVQGDTNRLEDVLLHDREMGTTRRVSVGTGGAQAEGISFSPSLSANGRFVAFGSQARNLVPGDTTLREDVFVRSLLP